MSQRLGRVVVGGKLRQEAPCRVGCRVSQGYGIEWNSCGFVVFLVFFLISLELFGIFLNVLAFVLECRTPKKLPKRWLAMDVPEAGRRQSIAPPPPPRPTCGCGIS